MRPTWHGILLNPFYFARRELANAVSMQAPSLRGRVLDFGCGSMPYRDLFPGTDYVGVEFDTPANRAAGLADAFYDGRHLPFAAREFDAAVMTQVLEHVPNPEEVLAEVRRVLKPGGILLLTVPFIWDEHEQPRDFRRYSSFGIADLLGRTGFSVETQGKTLADIRVLAQLLNAYLYKSVIRRAPRGQRVLTAVLAGPVNLAAVVLWRLFPRNPDLYLDNVVLARKRGE